MQARNHGKYTNMRKNSPRGIARCDYSGLMVAHHKLKAQYQYRGQGLVNTGYLVYPKFLDVPNAQDLTPLIKADPVPLINPRPDNIVDVVPDVTLELDVSGNTNVTLSAEQITNTNFIFTGTLTGNVIVFLGETSIPSIPPIPRVLNFGSLINFFAINKTLGNFTLSMQITGTSASALGFPPSNVVILRNQTMLLCNDGYTIHIINPDYQPAT